MRFAGTRHVRYSEARSPQPSQKTAQDFLLVTSSGDKLWNRINNLECGSLSAPSSLIGPRRH